MTRGSSMTEGVGRDVDRRGVLTGLVGVVGAGAFV
jgi:hypothetical protein